MTVQIRSYTAEDRNAETIGLRLAEQIRSQASEPLSALLVCASLGTNTIVLRNVLNGQFPSTPMLGTTSFLGVGSNKGYCPSPCASILAFYGNDAHFGTGFSAAASEQPFSQGEQMAQGALNRCGIPAAAARFAILFSAPGDESALLDGIYSVLPKKMPIVGGGIAGAEFPGDWRVWSEHHIGNQSAVLMVCDWPFELEAHFEGGYLKSGPSGIATQVENNRVIKTIDNRPAAEVYNEWMNGALSDKLEGGSILVESSLKPLGVATQMEGGFTTFFLLHPKEILPDKSIELFASIQQGEEVHLMFSQKASLIKRTKRLAKTGIARGSFEADELIGALLIYCAGSLAVIEDNADALLDNFKEECAAPFIAGFTFGEVGCVQPGVYGHGNLMAGALFLSSRPRRWLSDVPFSPISSQNTSGPPPSI
ncbi:MAG: FIST C-terminal domain-containing protein [Deltaproteobacteria bacterium]|nr:FIST C-terminal domain-containing protein [Deltaproteobacteria bacterium]